MGAAPMAYALWTRHLRHAPTNPHWPNRDRFVLSAGHASMLLYSLLHLTGYDVSLDDLKSFRQWGSITPGHPEYGLTPGRRGDHRPARPGPRQRGGHGDRRAAARGRVQPPGPRHRRPPDLRHRQRRRHAGGRRVRGELDRRPPAAGQADRAVRRQPDPARRADGLGVQRGRARPVRRLRLAHPAGRGRQRRGRDLGRHRRRQGRRAAVDHRGPDPHRLRQPEQAGHAEGARRAAGPGRGAPGQGGLRLGPGSHVLRAGRGRRRCSAARSTRARTSSPSGSRGSTGTRRSSRPTPRSWSGGSLGRLPDGWDAGLPAYEVGTEVATRNASQDTIQALARAAARAVRRLGGPVGVEPDRRQGERPGPLRGRPRRAATCASASASTAWARSRTASPTTAASSPTARRSSPSATTCAASVRLASLVRPARHLRLDPRLRRPRRGRADAPAGRALRGAAGDPEPVVRAAGRRQRGGRGLGAGGRAADAARGAAGPGRARVHPPEAADAGRARPSTPARGCGAAATSCARPRAGSPS